eukprot:3934568-Rhodomonas_salina.1
MRLRTHVVDDEDGADEVQCAVPPNAHPVDALPPHELRAQRDDDVHEEEEEGEEELLVVGLHAVPRPQTAHTLAISASQRAERVQVTV